MISQPMLRTIQRSDMFRWLGACEDGLRPLDCKHDLCSLGVAVATACAGGTVKASLSGVWALGFRVQGSGFRVSGLGFRAWDE